MQYLELDTVHVMVLDKSHVFDTTKQIWWRSECTLNNMVKKMWLFLLKAKHVMVLCTVNGTVYSSYRDQEEIWNSIIDSVLTPTSNTVTIIWFCICIRWWWNWLYWIKCRCKQFCICWWRNQISVMKQSNLLSWIQKTKRNFVPRWSIINDRHSGGDSDLTLFSIWCYW